jgi:hypothetical protein
MVPRDLHPTPKIFWQQFCPWRSRDDGNEEDFAKSWDIKVMAIPVEGERDSRLKSNAIPL